ncbi:MAG: FtsQ-type POTRA domain-containing protein [Actinomycetota bacterium]
MAEMSLRRRRAFGLIVGIPLVLALSLWALTFTPLFRAHHIRVQGATVLSPVEVRSLAGVDGSTNVVHLDDVGVVGRLEESPWIADASVHVELPDTLVLEITERRPVGVIDALGESGILASDATLLPMTAGAPSDLPAVRAALGAPSTEQRAAAATLLSALDPVVAKRVTEVLVGQDGLVALTLSSGATVNAGEAGDEASKAEVLRAVLRWATSKGLDVSSIDISAPTAPSATLSDGSTLTP